MELKDFVRRVDELGRVVIPAELRNKFDISEMEPIEFVEHEDYIVLKKYIK